jgi:hypothetical protein
MNSREKLLAAAVGLLALMMVVYITWSRVSSALASRHATLTNLQKEVDDQDRVLNEAAKASRKLADLQKRSLPVEQERAQSAYQQWLLNLVDWLEFIDPSVKVSDRRARGSYYHVSRFEVDANATFEQLTEFLTAFYLSGDLHRIQQLRITPVAQSRELDVFIVVEALSLPGAQRTTVGDVASTRLTNQDVSAIQETILNRNMFFPPNEPPKFERIADQRVVRGASMRLAVKATDADAWDTLAFDLRSEPIEGMKLEPRGDGEAELIWSPQENGDYPIELEVCDDGLPRRKEKASFKVTVVDPPPVAPSDGRRMIGFDDAKQTFLVGTVGVGEQREAWFSVRTTGQVLKLNKGAQFDVGSILGELTLIGDRFVEISTPDGVVQVRVGQSLGEAMAISPPSRQADSRP